MLQPRLHDLSKYPHCTFITKVFNEFNFISGSADGSIIEIEAEVLKTGTTSVTVAVKAGNAITGKEIFKTFAVMVNARQGKTFPIKPLRK
jgi:acyl-CoA hydrolase